MLKINRKLFLVLPILISFSLSSCVITYKRFPKKMYGADPSEKQYDLIHYNIHGVSMAGGHHAIRDALRFESPFRQVLRLDEKPDSGLFVQVEIKNVPPSVPALIFGYISLSTLTIFPAWSTKGGTTLLYNLYKDGTLLRTFEYDVRRKGVVWIVTLPLIWVNLFTPSEQGAFRATAFQFFEDAESLFSS